MKHHRWLNSKANRYFRLTDLQAARRTYLQSKINFRKTHFGPLAPIRHDDVHHNVHASQPAEDDESADKEEPLDDQFIDSL